MIRSVARDNQIWLKAINKWINIAKDYILMIGSPASDIEKYKRKMIVIGIVIMTQIIIAENPLCVFVCK